jgi:hypothetical protein
VGPFHAHRVADASEHIGNRVGHHDVWYPFTNSPS